MKVLYFSRGYTTHDYHFLCKISENGHEVWFLRLDRTTNYESRNLPSRVQEIEFPGLGNVGNSPESLLRLMPSYAWILREIRPDLVHAGPVQSCGFMTALSGFQPFVLMSWGADILTDTDDELWRWITRFTLAHSNLIVCDSTIVRTKIHDLVTYDDDHILQFPWGIDVDEFKPRGADIPLKRLENWEDSCLILCTRSWETIYGLETLLEAFQCAHSQNKRLRLVLAGNGTLALTIDSFIDTRSLRDVIFRPGRISHEQMPLLYRSVDVYVSCSLVDGTSVSLLEAMASGLPVVVSDIPGNREWVSHGQNGWLAKPGDEEDFARCLLLAAETDRAERERISNLNRKIIEVRANWEKNIERLMRAYDRLTSQGY